MRFHFKIKKLKIGKISWLLAGICSITLARAQDADTLRQINIFGFDSGSVLTSKVTCFLDTSGQTAPALPPQNRFTTPYPVFVRGFDRNPAKYTFWLEFSLRNMTDSVSKAYLYFGNLNYLDVYLFEGNRLLKHLKAGTLVAFQNSPSLNADEAVTVPLRLAPRQQYSLLVKIIQKTQDYDFAGINIYDEDTFYRSVLQDFESSRTFIVLQLIFQGILLSQILYVIFQWLIIRRKEYLYYVLYLITISLYFLSKYEIDLGVHIFFYLNPVWGVYLNKTLVLLPFFLYFRFVRSFLEMRETYPRINKWLVRLENFLLVYILFDFVFIITTFDVTLQRTLYTYILSGIFLTVLTFIIYLLGQKKTVIYYIILGSLFLGLGSITGLILTYVEYNLHYDTGIPNKLIFSQVGILLEIFCFTAGLSYKNKAAEKEKLKSQKELIEQMQVNNSLQRNMENIRNKIAQDLHDEIGSTLSSISILSNLALKEDKFMESRNMMEEIRENSMTLMEKMDDIVWSINTRNDSIDSLMLRIKRFAASLFEAKGIDYEIEIGDTIKSLKLSMEYRQNIYLIMKECINNLVKHAGATKAFIRVYTSAEDLQVEISDNGKSFDPGKTYPGNGILNMKSRASAINANLSFHHPVKNGSTVRLSLKIK